MTTEITITPTEVIDTDGTQIHTPWAVLVVGETTHECWTKWCFCGQEARMVCAAERIKGNAAVVVNMHDLLRRAT
jgi:hypothetical protein